MKFLKSRTNLLILILALGIFLRVYKLDSAPPGLTWDEASLGVNAYSISRTLKDEYGTFLPLTLKSFGDYKPALYAYLDIPFIMVLGLNEWAVRLPSVLAGIGFIILSLLITQEVFKDNRLSLSVAFFAAISPLSIQFSRAGFESNIAVTLNLLGLYFFLKAIKKPGFFFLSALMFSLSLLTYQGSKLFVPIIFIGLFIFFKNQIKIGRHFVVGILLACSVLLFVYCSTFLLGQSNRLVAQNLFAYRRGEEQINLISKEDGLERGTFQFQLLHGEWFKFMSGILERYLIYFSPDTLFIEGDYSPRHNVPDLGILNYYGLIFIPFGFYLLVKKRDSNKNIILYWLFTATIPAVLSRDLISMVRALNLMFPFAVLEGLGLYFLVKKMAEILKLNKPLVASALVCLVFINLYLYLDYYFVHAPYENSAGWLYGYKQVISQVPDFSKYNRVIFSDTYGQPYIYYLFYTKYSPEKFQSQAVLEQNTVDVGTIRKIDNIEFRPIYWPVDRGMKNTLFIGDEFDLPESDLLIEKKTKKLYQVNFINGATAFKVVENGND